VDEFINVVKQGVIALLVLGIFLYGIFMLLYAIGWPPFVVALMTSAKPSYMFGLPICAVTAFGVVSLLERLAPAAPGKMEFKAFGLTFSGPAGPVTLWVVVYLVLVASMKIIE